MVMSVRLKHMEKKNTRIIFDSIWIFMIFVIIISYQSLPLKWLSIPYHNWPNVAIFGYCLLYNGIILSLLLLGFKKGREEFLKGLSILLFYLIALTNQYLPLKLLGVESLSLLASITYSLIFEFLIIFIIIIICRKEIIPQFLEYKKNFKNYIKNYIKYWFITLGLMIIANLFIQPFTSDIAKNEAQVQSLVNSLPIYAFIVSVIYAPILEELIFRFSIQKISCYKKYLFIFMSGLVFGFMHIIGTATVWTDWLYLLPYSIPGWVFAYTLVKSNNIFVPISLHTIHNGILVTLQIITFMSK